MIAISVFHIHRLHSAAETEKWSLPWFIALHIYIYTVFTSPQYNSDSEIENHQNNLNYAMPIVNYHIIKAYSILNFMPRPSCLLITFT